MVIDSQPNSTVVKTRQYGPVGLLILTLALHACHRMPSPLDDDPRLPAPYSSPEKTFDTWVQATLSGNEQAIRDCYWTNRPEEELASWMRENLRPQARELFNDAKLTEVHPATLVEVNFTFTAKQGSQEIRGVMVRTRHGWKIQSW